MNRYILYLLLVLGFNDLIGQLANVSIDQIHEINALGVDANIKAVVKDSCNQIWVGADNGLYRFDGAKVNTLDFKYVKVIRRLQNEQIAVLTDEGLFSISTLPYSYHIDTLLLSSNKISEQHLFFPKSLYEDKYGTLWIGEDMSIVRFKNGHMRRFRVESIRSNGFLHRSYEFVEDGFGQLWAIAYSGQLLRYNIEDELFTIIKSGLWNEVSTATCLGNNEILIGAKTGVHKITLNERGDFLSTENIAEIPGVSKIKYTDDLALVATWEDGMYQVDSQRGVQKIASLQYAQIFDLFIEGNEVWIASRENIICIYSSPIELVTETQNKFVPSVNLLRDNRLVINTGRDVYLSVQSYKGLAQELLFTTEQRFWVNDATLVEDTLWMATSNGIYIYKTTTQELTQVVAVQDQDWNDKIFLDSKGVLWVSGKSKKPIISIENGQIKYWEKLRQCLSIVENKAGVLFAAGVGTTIFRQKDSDFEPLNIEFPDTQNLIINTLQFGKEALFLATNKGLWGIPSESLQTAKPQLIFEGNINSIVVDQYDDLWLAHNQGLIFWDKKDSTSLHFNRSNGLPSKHIVANGLTVDANRQIWMNTSKGVAKADIKQLTHGTTPKPHLNTLNIQNKERAIERAFLGVFSTDDFISLGMSALTFPVSDVLYRGTLYQNNKADYHWGAQRAISFSDLSPGSYTLKVEAKQSYLQWSLPVFYTFSVQKPWYKTNWFYALTTICITGLVFFFTRLYNQRLRRSNERLESLVAKRTENLEQQKNDLIRNQKQIIAQQKEIIDKNTNLAEIRKALTASEIKYLEVKKNQIQSTLALRTKQLTTHTLHLVEKNQLLLELSEKLEVLSQSKNHKETTQNIKKLSRQIKNVSKNDNHWESFRLYFEQVHRDFYTKLKVAYPNLTSNDLKQCALVKLNLSLEDSATLLGVSSESVRISRYRIQKKMNLSSQSNFYDYLMKL